MRKIFLSLATMLMLYHSRAQVLINLQMPQAGLQIKSQLWTMSLVNTSAEILSIKLDMTLTDVPNGQLVLTGSSNIFLLPAGAKQIQIRDILPVQYNVLNSSYNVNNTPDGFLPVGVFNVCFSILKRNAETLDKIAEECETIEVEPASPPFLTMPDDQVEIDQNRPLFIWLPPSPIFLFKNLSYELKLVEVNNNQIASDAIQNNTPILNQSSIGNSSFQYPFSVPALDTSKLYAWQVKALNDMQPISNSEIFTFRLKKQKDSLIKESNVYVKLKELSEVPFTVCNGILRYEYVNVYNNSILNLELTDITSKNNQKISLSETFQKLAYGQNFLSIDFSTNNKLVNDHIYQLVVSTTKGEKQAVKFIYKKDN